MSIIDVMEIIVQKRTERISRAEDLIAGWSEKVRTLSAKLESLTEEDPTFEGLNKLVNFYRDTITKESERIAEWQEKNEEDLREIEAFRKG